MKTKIVKTVNKTVSIRMSHTRLADLQKRAALATIAGKPINYQGLIRQAIDSMYPLSNVQA